MVGKSGRACLGGRNAPAVGRQARPDLSAAKSGKKQEAGVNVGAMPVLSVVNPGKKQKRGRGTHRDACFWF